MCCRKVTTVSLAGETATYSHLNLGNKPSPEAMGFLLFGTFFANAL